MFAPGADLITILALYAISTPGLSFNAKSMQRLYNGKDSPGIPIAGGTRKHACGGLDMSADVEHFSLVVNFVVHFAV